ncbi:hypothetical protein E308F_00910 [Moorella sp. E308F]|uniref:hypothetical protein n=1 Tax=Moorella sp. E308F TaxID=2572682 RepID=UPI0010FFB5E0|nr:hypothetical protein [Moorella sp. E308F]GEA13851.1 hypothetical protein E308F_00910 [Moorella sp. E308F]
MFYYLPKECRRVVRMPGSPAFFVYVIVRGNMSTVILERGLNLLFSSYYPVNIDTMLTREKSRKTGLFRALLRKIDESFN